MLPVVLITGKGRSGTTWLAQILNSYEGCSYKHEPFAVAKGTPYALWRAELEDGDNAKLRAAFDALARHAFHGVDMPPFPPKRFRRGHPTLLRGLYALGHRSSLARRLYELYARPRLGRDDSILVKDVNFPSELLPRLCDSLDPTFLAVVRNPFANVASHLSGVSKGLFSARRPADEARAREVIDSPVGKPFEPYRDQLESLSTAAFEALRWRIQVEPLVAFAEQRTSARVVVYERLCARPLEETQAVFDLAGWALGPATRDFIEASTSGNRPERSEVREYFSVYRNPRDSVERWREQLSEGEKADIAAVFRDSPIRQLWPDLGA